MRELTGIPLPNSRGVADLEWVRDLEYFEGPIVSHFRGKRGGNYLRYWVDLENQVNRWMLARVSENNIIRLQSRNESLDNVIPLQCESEFVYFIDTLPGGGQTAILVYISDIPDEYTPGEGSLLRPPKMEGDRLFPLLIQSSPTEDQFADITRKFRQAYSILYLLNTATSVPIHSHPWHGDGYSSMHFYREIAHLITGEAHLNLEKVQYASPGFMQYDLHRPTAEHVSRCVALAADKKSDASKAFTALGSYIRRNKLDSLDQKKSDWLSHDKELSVLTYRLLAAIGVADPGFLIAQAPRPIEAAKIARSIVERLNGLARYEKDGVIVVPQD
jgi:hypothetical protein